MKFGLALPNIVTAVAYTEYENVIEIVRGAMTSLISATDYEHDTD